MAHATRLADFKQRPADSCIVYGGDRPITKVMASINATTGDLLLAKQLGCDGYLLHHPLAGSARREFSKVLDRMRELMVQAGVSKEHAEVAIASLRARCRFNDHASDWDHLASTARLLDLPLLNIHLAADELGRVEMVRAIRDVPVDATVAQVADALRSIPELAHEPNEIIILAASDDAPAGRVAVMHAGGTNGGAAAATCLFDHATHDPRGPIGTVVYIHVAGPDAEQITRRQAEGKAGNLIVSGHFASDAIGMNILLKAFEDEHGIEFVRHGGLSGFPAR